MMFLFFLCFLSWVPFFFSFSVHHPAWVSGRDKNSRLKNGRISLVFRPSPRQGRKNVKIKRRKIHRHVTTAAQLYFGTPFTPWGCLCVIIHCGGAVVADWGRPNVEILKTSSSSSQNIPKIYSQNIPKIYYFPKYSPFLAHLFVSKSERRTFFFNGHLRSKMFPTNPTITIV